MFYRHQRLFINFIFLLLIPLNSCSLFKKNDPFKLSTKEEEKLNELKAEIEIGRNMAGRLLQFYGTYEDAELLKYINTVGQYVAKFSDHPERRYMFAILDTDSVNAFACPGGYILITLGTIKMAQSEAELAMILGHEITHVGNQHMFKTLISMNERDREKEAKELDNRANSDAPYSVKVRERPTTTNKEGAALLARYLSGSSGASLSILEVAKAGMNMILEKGLDKKFEFEADDLGVRYAIRAGYTPEALITFLARLDSRKKMTDTKILERTHPSIMDRTNKATEILNLLDSKSIIGAIGGLRFAKATSKLGAITQGKHSEKEG